jgi:glycosyltransferase involved in cell wall biosynthesis
MNKVSIIIPTYNRGNIIGETITSIVNQTYKEWEIIIVDDGSTDRTEQTIEDFMKFYPIKYGKINQNKGPSFARNTGMKVANGSYAAFLDSDDVWASTFLEKLSSVLDDNYKVGLVYCDSQLYDEKKTPQYKFTFPDYDYKKLLNSDGMIPTGSFLFRTKYWNEVGEFREDMMRAEDFEWQIRLGERVKFKHHPETLHHYYRNKNGLISTTGRNPELLKSNLRILRNTQKNIKERLGL